MLIRWKSQEILLKNPHFSEICDAVIPRPVRATILFPVIKRCLAAGDPGKVVSTAASSQYLAAGIWFLNTFVIIAIDHGCLVRPIIFAASEIKGLCGGGNVVDLLWIATCRTLSA